MAIEVNLEKYGHKKKGFIGFSWTAFFFDFLVPLIRLDLKWLFIFLAPYILYISIPILIVLFVNDSETLEIFMYPYIASIVLINISHFVLPFIYNKFYTKSLLKKGYLPPEDDDYSNAILKGNRYLEYTNEDLKDSEKMERYRLIIEEYEKERKKDIRTLIIVLALLALLIGFFIFIPSY